MTQPDCLPKGMRIFTPQTETFAEVRRRLGVAENSDGCILIRYDQRSGWFALTSAGIASLLLYRSFPLISNLVDTPHSYAVVMLVLIAAILAIFLAVFARFIFIAVFGAHWFLCAPDSIHVLRYAPVSSRAVHIDRSDIDKVEIVGDDRIMKTHLTLALALHSGVKRTLVKLDPSKERISCLKAILDRRYAECMDEIGCREGAGC